MAIDKFLLLFVVLGYIVSVARSECLSTEPEADINVDDSDDDGTGFGLNKKMFPSDFVFGAGSSAYQAEGAAYEDGKGQSIWDNFTAAYPEKIADKSSGMVAADSYHRYKEDVAAIKNLGLDAYRFSISWPRILPTGKRSGGINKKGVEYYHNLIDELRSNGIEPYVTIFHWDLPQALEDEYGGFLSEKIVDDFRDYADLLFSLYGEKVNYWTTINEPWSYAVMGYAYGVFPPTRCNQKEDLEGDGFGVGRFFNGSGPKCTGDSSVEPYLVAHHLILAHAAAVKVYREKYQSSKGKIGITLNVQWMVPFGGPGLQRDRDATTRAIAFNFGWFMEPIHIGTYPTEMVTRVGDRLPEFTMEQKKMVKGSFDYIGINYYTASYAKDIPCSPKKDFFIDPCVNVTYERGGTLIGEEAGSTWLHVFPWGLRQLLVYTKNRYNNPVIYITENGVSKVNKGVIQPDAIRENYHRRHIQYVHEVIKEINCNVKGYFIWSLMDNFEWLDGYSVRFGILFVDFEHGSLNRTYKDSTNWLRKFLNPRN